MYLIVIVLAAVMSAMPAGVHAQNPSYLDWQVYDTEHFSVYYPKGQEFTAFQAVHIAEQVHAPLVDMYGPLDSKVAIVINDTEDYANGGAYFYDNKVVISATWLDFEFRSPSDWLWNVVTHELTHIYSMRQTMKAPRWLPMAYYQHIDYQEEKREDVLVGYPNIMASYPLPMFTVPSWLSEGVAQYQARPAQYDRWDTHRDMILRQAVLNDTMLTIDEMSYFNWTGINNEKVYNHGYSLVRYIAHTYGDSALKSLMAAMSDRTAVSFDHASKDVLGMDQDELYAEWKTYLTGRYEAIRDSLGPLVGGTVLRTGGFINDFPTWSPDGTKLAYVSNRGSDYSTTYCRVANLTEGGWQWPDKEDDIRDLDESLRESRESAEDSSTVRREMELALGAFDITLGGGIQSGPIWLDEWNVLYNRRMHSDKYGSHWWDMYRYVINTEDPRKGTEERITESLRGNFPDLSPDKRRLVFVRNEAGLNNLYIMDRNDNNLTQITEYTDGTQIYRPRWSPDGSRIAFTIQQRNEVNIGVVNADGSGFEYLVSSPVHDRDPAWTRDGKSLVFSSDINGIANLYRMDIATGRVAKLTNVIGGAFAPAVSPADTTIAFSYYGPDGYEIRTIPCSDGTPVDDSSLFRRPVVFTPVEDIIEFEPEEARPYTMETLDFSFMPAIRNDRGNLKLGTYAVKSEVVEQGEFMFFGAVSPTNHDSDLYAQFMYRKLVPDLFIEMYRQTRSVDTNENYMEEDGTIIRKRIFDLNEIDFGVNYTYRDDHEFESRLIYSQYNAKVEYTHYLSGPQIHKPYYTYSRGFDLAFIYRYDQFIRARDEEINPRGGRRITARYDRVYNYFLDDFEYVGFLREKYNKYPYSKFYLNWVERIPVPKTEKHTLLLRGQLNMIDTQVDPFYEEQLGGPNQMRGYTFYSLSGRKNIMGQALYRFPVWRDIRKGIASFYLNNIYMGVFADIGKAWNKRSLNWSTDAFKRDAGVEVRVDAISFYNFPTMIEFSAAYGPDDTWIRHFDEDESREYWKKDSQDPWNFYFSVLFGFN